ncbi:MAG: alanine dehydrogenase [Dehalococcoidia bacterium]
MLLAVPRETKNGEFRIALTPQAIGEVVAAGHSAVVERGAGEGAGLLDREYEAAGARIGSREEAWAADLIVKVKEPSLEEASRLRAGQILFAYLHLAGATHLVEPLKASGATAIAFETVEDEFGRAPLLYPMSALAGRLAPQIGAHFLERTSGGRGVLLSGFESIGSGMTTVIGAGVVGQNAAMIASGLGSRVLVADTDKSRAESLAGGIHRARAVPVGGLAEAIAQSDLVIGGVYISGEHAPRVAGRAEIRAMRPGSVIVDVSIDQGGCFETSRPTSHEEPTYIEEGVVHYCVPNIPSMVANTATRALSATLLPYVKELMADPDGALSRPPLSTGLNVRAGRVVHPAVAEAVAI